MPKKPEETPDCASGNSPPAAESRFLSRSQFSLHCTTSPQFHPVIANTELFIHALKTQTIRRCISFILPGRMKTKHLSDIEKEFLVYQFKARPRVRSSSYVPHHLPDNTCAPPSTNSKHFLCLRKLLCTRYPPSEGQSRTTASLRFSRKL